MNRGTGIVLNILLFSDLIMFVGIRNVGFILGWGLC